MALPLIPLVSAVILISLALYRYVLVPAFLSPLARIPNAHWSAPISRLWILNERRLTRETRTIHAAHQRLGPIVRLGPNDISVNSVDGGIRNVYAGGYPKGDWYLNVFNNYGIKPMFSMPDHNAHSKRKRMLSNIYAKSTLQASPAIAEISRILLDERLNSRLREIAMNGKPVEFYWIFSAITHDFVSAYVFGLKNGSDFIMQPDMGHKFFREYKSRQDYQFWPQEVPLVTKCLEKCGLLWMIYPAWVRAANLDIEGMILGMVDKAEKTVRQADNEGENGKAEDWPTVYAHLRTALLKEDEKSGIDTKIDERVATHRLTLASEMLDHTLAGFDTSSITLMFLAWELSRPENLHWQDKLRAELLSLPNKHDAKDLDALPTLQAILMESLRLHAAIPGNQPRITPPDATLGAPGHDVSGLPPGVRVQAQAWSLHRNPEVFPQPEFWNPGRWLDSSEEHMKEMQRWFWAFGSGGRMCVGSNLAMLDMKAIIAGIWTDFRTTAVKDDGMIHNGGYVAEPVGKDGIWLLARLQEVHVEA